MKASEYTSVGENSTTRGKVENHFAMIYFPQSAATSIICGLEYTVIVRMPSDMEIYLQTCPGWESQWHNVATVSRWVSRFRDGNDWGLYFQTKFTVYAT